MINYTECQTKSDEDLVALTLTNQDYFSCLIKRYEAKLRRYVLRLSNFPHEEAEDILQEVFLKIYQNLNAFDKNLKFSSWAYRITYNQVISNYRKNKKRILSASWDIDNDLVLNIAADFDVKKELDQKTLQEQIAKVLKSMDFKYAQVLELKFLEEKSYQEISDILQKPPGTVASLINRAKKQFQRELARQNLKI